MKQNAVFFLNLIEANAYHVFHAKMHVVCFREEGSTPNFHNLKVTSQAKYTFVMVQICNQSWSRDRALG